MDKQLIERVNEHIDYLIDSITKKDQINEGLIQDLSPMCDTLKKNRDFNKILASYKKCLLNCNKNFESKTELDKKNDVYQKLDDNKISDRDFKETRKVDEKILKENPQKSKCIMNCRLTLLKSIIELLKKDGKKICKKSKSEDKCNKWLEDNLEDFEMDIEYLEETMKKIGKIKNDKQIQSLLSKLLEKFV